jgi:hypothetical protein
LYAEHDVARAQTNPALRMHTSLEGGQRPMLCRDRQSINLIVPIVSFALEARSANDKDKSARLTDIATRLQNELCVRPAADDIVVLRCRLSQRDIGGTRLSAIRLSALLRAEASKGEQPFFAWTFADIDDSGAGTDEAKAATARWCGNDEVAGGAVAVTPDIVLQVQQRLYDFGLRIPDINGQLSHDTVQALTLFQKWANLPANGLLNKQTLERIATTPAPSPWVSIAFDGSGNFGAQTGTTRRGAEQEAIQRLQRRSRGDFKLSSVASPSCLALAMTRYAERGRRSRTTFTQTFTSAGDAADTASKNAWDYCEREKGGGQCGIRHVLCADGPGAQVKRFDKDAIPVNSPAPRFDPSNLPLNAPPPSRFNPAEPPTNAPMPSRSDTKDLPVNAPAPPQ